MPLDTLFSSDGLRTALEAGCRLHEDVYGARVYLEAAALVCDSCGDDVDPPSTRPARYLALQSVVFEGDTYCVECLRDG